jgi:N-acetylneuraminic acid mutarotase
MGAEPADAVDALTSASRGLISPELIVINQIVGCEIRRQKRWGIKMKSRVFTSPIMVLALLSFQACGGGENSTHKSASAPHEWTWLSGSDLANQLPVYGTMGAASPSNVVGGRSSAAGWIDASGNLWILGGEIPDSSAPQTINDLWKYSAGEWTWMGGANVPDQPSVYGTQGVSSPSNAPGARYPGGNWIGPSGDLWLFGGLEPETTPDTGWLNDLWRYSAGQWTWMGGSNSPDQPGVYGTQGVASSSNIPGARFSAVSWTDRSGNFWLFGGDGPTVGGVNQLLNDLWKYNAGEWTWMSGSSTSGQPGIYGTQGTAASTNAPGARVDSTGCADASGNLWLFGGVGFDSQGASQSFLNDLWKYSAGKWTWMSGPSVSNPVSQLPTYGTQGTSSATNVPGGRYSSVCWADASGNVWLFGGDGYDSTGNFGDLNDFWKFSAGQWTWVSGANVVNESGIYGTQGTPSPGNFPGARMNPVALTDSFGNFWLFGGGGIDSSGTAGYLNDLWAYQP